MKPGLLMAAGSLSDFGWPGGKSARAAPDSPMLAPAFTGARESSVNCPRAVETRLDPQARQVCENRAYFTPN
jgi:hypothetical protein